MNFEKNIDLKNEYMDINEHLATGYANLAGFVHNGNNSIAIHEFDLAANEDCALAFYYLGICYADGLGVARDSEEALNYMLDACDMGCDKAFKACGELYLEYFDEPDYIGALLSYANVKNKANCSREIDSIIVSITDSIKNMTGEDESDLDMWASMITNALKHNEINKYHEAKIKQLNDKIYDKLGKVITDEVCDDTSYKYAIKKISDHIPNRIGSKYLDICHLKIIEQYLSSDNIDSHIISKIEGLLSKVHGDNPMSIQILDKYNFMQGMWYYEGSHGFVKNEDMSYFFLSKIKNTAILQDSVYKDLKYKLEEKKKASSKALQEENKKRKTINRLNTTIIK